MAAKKKIKHNRKVTPIVMNKIGVNCEKTLNPWTTFILLDTPDIIKPAAKVKLNKNAVNISFIILLMSLNSLLLIAKPIINKSTPTPIQILADMSWLRFHVGLR